MNIAIDLQDGVRLAHFVEMFLLSAQRLTWGETTEDSARQGPKHQVFTPTRDRPLSKQLKVPCVGRAQKIHNVQITLDALQSISRLVAVHDHVKAEDMVDGHREKVYFFYGHWSEDRLEFMSIWGSFRAKLRRQTVKVLQPA